MEILIFYDFLVGWLGGAVDRGTRVISAAKVG
jgi:hypothetical protein